MPDFFKFKFESEYRKEIQHTVLNQLKILMMADIETNVGGADVVVQDNVMDYTANTFNEGQIDESQKIKIDVVPNEMTVSNGRDLPQDMPFSSPEYTVLDDIASDQGAISESSPAESCDVNRHTWVSPNKSDEVLPSSTESTPDDNLSEQTVNGENKSPMEMLDFEESISADSTSETNNCEEDFELSVLGKSLQSSDFEKSNVPSLRFRNVSDPTLCVDVSNKDWIQIVHDGKEIFVPLPTMVSLLFEKLSDNFNILYHSTH